MKNLLRTTEFAAWLRSVRDDRALARIALRIDRLGMGNAGDSKSVGGGIRELRIDYGPGYRVYYASLDNTIILLVCGGTKKSQQTDIKTAVKLFGEWKSKKHDQDRGL